MGGTGYMSWTSLSSVQHTSADGLTVYEQIDSFSSSIAGPGSEPPNNQYLLPYLLSGGANTIYGTSGTDILVGGDSGSSKIGRAHV